MNKDKKDYKEEYNDFWKDIVENEDGSLNKGQVMRELSDYSMIIDNCERAYYTMTDGAISKPNTMFFEVEGIFNSKYFSVESNAKNLIATYMIDHAKILCILNILKSLF